jgi:hypothetical protein
MKNIKARQSLVCSADLSKSSWVSMSLSFLTWMVVLTGCLMSGILAHAAPVNLLRFPLTNAPGITVIPSDTSLGGVSVNLSTYNGAGAAKDLGGLTGSGVNGLSTGASAMSFTNGQTGNATQSANANGAANSAADLGDATLAFGSVSNFVVTMWFKEPIVYSDASGNTLPRLFVLSNGGGSGANDATANSIGVKFQLGNQFIMSIDSSPATTTAYVAGTGASLATTLASDLLANKWYFVAWVYDSTNIYQFTGSDTAVATLQNQFAAPGLVVNLGNPSTLLLGNRNWKGTRGFFGSMEDFRFYTNVASAGNNASFVESIRAAIAPKIPTIIGAYPDGGSLLQATNKLVFTATSPSGFNLTNIALVLNNVNVSAGLSFVTNGTAGTSTNVTATYTGLPQQALNTAVISAMDGLGLVGSATVNFDTFNPTNFIIKAEEFDFGGGQFIDNPVYTNVAEGDSYFGLDSVEGIDTHKGQLAGAGNDVNDYRATDGTGTRTQTPLITGELSSPTRFGGNVVPSHMVGNWSSAEWQNYTKTFPAGNYNVYARVSTSSGSTINFDNVISGQGTSSQTLSRLGQFNFIGSGAFQWVPLRQFGSLAVVSLSGQQTLRATTGGGANADFYMFVLANTNLPTISNVYPDGQYLFEATNKLVFTVSSSVTTIATNNIVVTLNGTNISSALTFSGGPSTWNASYSALQFNQTYSTVIQVTDNNSATANATLTIDTWNPILQVEAEGFDFDPSLSLIPGTGNRYIDNPVPTAPLVPAANSYEGQVGDVDIDEHGNIQTNKSPIAAGFAGATFANYRTNDPCATAPVTDAQRRQFTGGSLDYNVGFLGAGHWEQYTRTWPNGTYNVYARVASGANLGTLYSSWSQVIAGWGTTNQVTRHIGTFAMPSSGGYSSYLYTPLIDRFGNYAQLTLNGTNTFRDTHLVFNQTETPNPAVFGMNINFYMLLAPRTDLPRIDAIYPDGTTPMQQTNTFSFVASNPTYGIATNNIQVTLNGVNISTNLVFSGSSSSWNVSYPGLQPNTGYSAVVTIIDNNNQTHSITVNFDTFSANNFTWEAEDFDFDTNNSPVPNGSVLRYIDNPVPTSAPATNSYYGQTGVLDIDYSSLFLNVLPAPAVYRSTVINNPNASAIPIEVTADSFRQKYQNAQLTQINPYIQDYDIFNLTNSAWINYTHTSPTGNFYVYARLSAGSTNKINLQCAQVTSGAGTSTQTTNVLGYFQATGNSYATWQYAPLVNTNTSLPVVLSLNGVETLEVTGDGFERVNFFMLVPVLPNSITITPSVSGPNIVLSFLTQTGYTYTMYYKNNLTDSTWTQLVGGGNPVIGNGLTQSVTDGLSQSHRFYRLTIQ